MGNQISYNKDDLDKIVEPKCDSEVKTCGPNKDQPCNKPNCSDKGEVTYYVTKGKNLYTATDHDFKCIKTKYEGKDVVACKLKDGPLYDSIESILEDTAYTEKNKLAAAKACSTGLVWKNRNPYVGSYGTASDEYLATDTGTGDVIRKLLGKRLKEVILTTRGDYGTSNGEMKIIDVGIHQNSCNMLNDIAPCRSNYAKTLYTPTGDINMRMALGKINEQRKEALLDGKMLNSKTTDANNALKFQACMTKKIMGKHYPVIEVLDEEDILDCELGPIEKTLGASKKFGKESDSFADKEEYCQTFPERCWLTGSDKLIEHQKKKKEYRESTDPQKEITMVFPYKFNLADNVIANYCPSCTRFGIGYDPSKVDEAKRKNQERMQNEKDLANLGSVSSASSSLDKAQLQNANAQIQQARREMEELKKAMANRQNAQTPSTTTTTTIVTPASDTNIFKKHKVIIIIGFSVFLILIILLLIL